MAAPRDPAATRRGFTLIELLVVIAVIGMLASILVPVLFRAKKSAKVRWAQKEISELSSAISLYYQDHSAYPPDTQNWSAAGGNTEEAKNIDPKSINRYLGSKIVDWRNEQYDAYMSMTYDRLIDRDADGVGRFTDPFGTPYELDSMHMQPPDPMDPASSYRQRGWPYILASPDSPTAEEKQKMSHDFKFVSYGPDTETEGYPFDTGILKDPPVTVRQGKAKDDICSWK